MKYLITFLFIILGASLLPLTAQRVVNNDDGVNADDYGRNMSIGISLIGRGIVGLPIRFVRESGDQIEIVPAFSGRGYSSNDEFEYDSGFSLCAGYNLLMGSKFKERKNKLIKNYIGLKAAFLLASPGALEAGITWHREAFFEGDFNYSRGLDLGLVFSRSIDGQYLNINGDLVDSEVQLFLRFDWNWFRN